MKFYALPKVDGGVMVMQTEGDPAAEIERWHPDRRALITGDVHEIAEADYRAMPSQGPRGAWVFKSGKLDVDAAKKAEIEALPPRLTLEQRLAALERRS